MALSLTARPGIDGPIHCINNHTGEEMTIEVLQIRGNQVRISFTASNNITILRDSVYKDRQKGRNK